MGQNDYDALYRKIPSLRSTAGCSASALPRRMDSIQLRSRFYSLLAILNAANLNARCLQSSTLRAAQHSISADELAQAAVSAANAAQRVTSSVATAGGFCLASWAGRQKKICCAVHRQAERPLVGLAGGHAEGPTVIGQALQGRQIQVQRRQGPAGLSRGLPAGLPRVAAPAGTTRSAASLRTCLGIFKPSGLKPGPGGPTRTPALDQPGSLDRDGAAAMPTGTHTDFTLLAPPEMRTPCQGREGPPRAARPQGRERERRRAWPQQCRPASRRAAAAPRPAAAEEEGSAAQPHARSPSTCPSLGTPPARAWA